jgi:hypothetical protein
MADLAKSVERAFNLPRLMTDLTYGKRKSTSDANAEKKPVRSP